MKAESVISWIVTVVVAILFVLLLGCVLSGCGGGDEPFEANGDGTPVTAPADPASDAKHMKPGTPDCSQGACK